ncbi:MAG: aldo/keto reductase [Actinomycetota bacterium]|nr:aldo/keto reductase [Actinomycetota bacterium]
MRFVDVNGVHLSAIGVGCWQFGSSDWGYGNDYGDKTAVDILHRALDLGVNLVDTAEIYARGASESIVGRAIAERRKEVFVATKLTPVWPDATHTYEHGRLSAMRLGIETIDLYQVHFPNPVMPAAQTMKGMRRLQDEGLVRNAGVSNYSAAQWRGAEEALGHPVLSNQVRFNLLQRKPEKEVLPHAQAADRLVIAYSPLGQGLLGGRYDKDNRPSSPTRLSNPLFLPENLDRVTPLIDTLRQVAKTHDATPAQVALAWLVRQPNVVAIPGASSVEQVEHNAAAADLELTEDDAQRLTAASDRFQPVSGVAAVPKLIRSRFFS